MDYKKIAAVLAAAAIIGSTSYALTDTFLFNDVITVSAASSLRKNSTGSAVKQLQNDLIKLNYLKSGSATGTYDAATEAAVKKFQTDYHLTADGVAGTQTLNMISSAVNGTKIIEVKSTLLNVRQTPSTKGRLITTVKAGQTFNVKEEASDSDGTKWYKISTKVGSGYVCSDYVTVLNQNSTVSANTTIPKSGIIRVTGSVLNVRQSASTSSKKLYTVKSGQTYYYTDTKTVDGERWYYIKVNKNVSGWVLGKWATPIESIDDASSSSKSGKLKVVVNILQVRQSPSTTAKRLYTTKLDEEYSYSNVKKVDGVDWYYIKVNDSISGWVLGTMVSATPNDSSPKTTETTKNTDSTTTKTADSKNNTLTITANMLNVREFADLESKKVFTVKKGQTYSYSKTKKVDDDTWYYIKVNNSISGWVIGTYVTVASESSQTTETTSATSAVTDESKSGRLRIEASSLNVRTDANKTSRIITTVKKSSELTYTDVKTVNGEKWYCITLSNSKKGWVNGSYVTLINTTAKAPETTASQTNAPESTTSETKTPETQSTTAAPTVRSGKLKVEANLLNVRAEASSTATVIATVKKDQIFDFTKTMDCENVTWYYINVSNVRSGWVMGSYVTVTNENPSPSNSGQTGTLTVIGTSVNIRSGAGTDFAKITSAKKDSRFTFTDYNNGWYCIKLPNNQIGWINANYVKVDEPTTTTSTTSTTEVSSSNTETTTSSATSTTSSSEAESSTTAVSTTTGVPVSPTAAGVVSKTVMVGTVKVSANTLIVRSGPGSSYSSIGSVKNGSTVVIAEKGSKWHKIEYGSKYGYVSASCIKNIRNETQGSAMSFDSSYYYINVGQSINLGRNVSGATVTYSSSDPAKCPVTDKGVASGVKEGLYEITVKSGNTTVSTCVVVLAEPNKNIQPLDISEKGIQFIAEWEGGCTILPSGKTVFYPYKDVSGYWTIGYGHAKTTTASKSWSENRAIEEFNKDIEKLIGEEYKLTSKRPYLTEEAAKKLLLSDMNEGDYVKAISNWAVRNGVILNQTQFDALVSFCYNIGPSLWDNDSTKFYLKSAIISHRSGDKANADQIIEGFCRYHKSNDKAYKGLWYRRRNEAELFLTGDYALDRENKFNLPTDISWS